MLYIGVAERWINIGLFFYRKVYNNSSENGDMSNKKEETLKSLSPKAYGQVK
jgi:hypothetical protein